MSIVDDTRIKQTFDPTGEKGGYSCDYDAGPDEEPATGIVAFDVAAKVHPSFYDYGCGKNMEINDERDNGDIARSIRRYFGIQERYQKDAKQQFCRERGKSRSRGEMLAFQKLKTRIAEMIANERLSKQLVKSKLRSMDCHYLINVNGAGIAHLFDWLEGVERDRQVAKRRELAAAYGTGRKVSAHYEGARTGRWSGKRFSENYPAHAVNPCSEKALPGWSEHHLVSVQDRDALMKNVERAGLAAIEKLSSEDRSMRDAPVECEMHTFEGEHYRLSLTIRRVKG